MKIFNINKGKRKIAHIIDGKYDKEGNTKNNVYISDTGEYEEIIIGDDEKRRFFPAMLDFEEGEQTSRVYISGMSGSGKSTLGNKIIKEILNREPEKIVYIISPLSNNEKLINEIDENSIIDLDLNSMNAFPLLDELSNSIIVFDDIDSYPEERFVKKIYNFVNQVMQAGRKNNIDVIFINHTLQNYRETKYVIQESNFVIVFPGTGTDIQIENYLKKYGCLDKKTINRILSTNNSRWVLVSNIAPRYILSEKELYTPTRVLRKTYKKNLSF